MSGYESGGIPSAPSAGVSWGGQPQMARRAITVAATAAIALGMAAPATAQAATESSAERVSVIVRELPGAGDAPERAVRALGGSVDQPLGIIGGFSATVPADGLDTLRSAAGVGTVSEDAAVALHDADTVSQRSQTGSLYTITRELTGAAHMWDRGFTGRGVDVAVIDSGVVPVDGLRAPGKVVHGPDLSFEAQVCDESGCRPSPTRNLDTYGHGTAMAGIIAGRDDAVPGRVTSAEAENFLGVAPDARIVSVKVADARGASDVSQVIAAIDWVVQNRKKNGLNIRVLNLSFGTDGVQSYQLDPLAYAAEQAWHKGIAVIVAAGNGGYGSAKLNNPAYDPYLIAVGGSDPMGTFGPGDDVVQPWSSTGDGTRNPDLVAPGASVVSLRSPGSHLDQTFPGARVGERFFRGSGTSQAAAVVSGAAALLIQQRPSITPDQLKAVLRGSAKPLPRADRVAQGQGTVDLKGAWAYRTPAAVSAVQTWPRATGLGSLELARGSAHVTYDGVPLQGEVDVTGLPWVPGAHTVAEATESTWTGGGFTGSGWDGGSWRGRAWYGGYDAAGLSGIGWSGIGWSGIGWSGIGWSGIGWSGIGWSGIGWSGIGWSGIGWSGTGWA